MIVTLSTDNHLGTRRQAHTTQASAKRLQQMLFTQSLVATADTMTRNYCLGDLLDKAHNDEATLLQAFTIGQRYSMVLAGNHDETNREGSVTTLRALQHMGVPVISSPDLSTPYFAQVDECFFAVPHHASQELFIQALLEAKQAAAQCEFKTYLLLHTNYNVPFGTEDCSLNLTPELADDLLEVFEHILIGHEHNPKQFHKGRLTLLGNTHPTSFSDISDKYKWRLDTETGELTKIVIWQKRTNYREIVYGEPMPDLTGVQFVVVTGRQNAESAADVAQFVREIWDTETPSLLAVRNDVSLLDHLEGTTVDTSQPALIDLAGRIHADLEGSDLQSLYDQLVKTAQTA